MKSHPGFIAVTTIAQLSEDNLAFYHAQPKLSLLGGLCIAHVLTLVQGGPSVTMGTNFSGNRLREDHLVRDRPIEFCYREQPPLIEKWRPDFNLMGAVISRVTLIY